MSKKFSTKTRFSALSLLFSLITLLLVSGCNGGKEVAITDLVPLSKGTTPPIEVVVGGEPESIRAEASGASVSLTYEWEVLEEECGQIEIIEDTEPIAKYHPPDNLQTSGKSQKCTIKVEGFLAGKSVGTAYLEVRVIPITAAVDLTPPTPTPTDISTPTPTEPLATDTPMPADTPSPTKESTVEATSTTVVNATFVDEPPTIDGRLDEAVWSQAQPLTYAVHPWVNDSTTVVVRLLWDDKYLYAGFDVSDTQVESSSIDNVFDGDSVSIIIENGGQIQEYRYSLPADRAGTTASESNLKGATTLNVPSDQDEGYTVEMRIPWETPPVADGTIAADFLSVDHDQNPEKRYDHPDTVFSKISWDGDQSVDTAGKSILLSAPTELSATDTPTPTDTPTSTPTPDGTRPPWCVPFSRPSASNTTLEGEAQLAFPEDCAELEYINEFTGTSSDLPEGVQIWVLVYPKNRRYYPQSDDASQRFTIEPVNGRWSVITYLGAPESGPEKFDIVVVLANPEASTFFSDKLEEWASGDFFPGLGHGELPNGIMEVQSITVMRTR